MSKGTEEGDTRVWIKRDSTEWSMNESDLSVHMKNKAGKELGLIV